VTIGPALYGTARRAALVEPMLNVAQMFVELHLISPAWASDLQGHPWSLEVARIDRH